MTATLTQIELGARIRAARETSRLTQDAVARHLGLSRTAVVQLEAGHRSVSSLELGSLAYLFGRDIRELLAPSFHDEDPLGALFRAQPDVGQHPSVMKTLRACIALGRELTELESLVGIDRRATATAGYAMAAPRARWEAIGQGERLADEERRRLGIGSGPLPDLVEVLESQGVRTGLVNLPEDISGITLSEGQGGLFVVANRAHHHLRRRFSFAHEYAHVVVDRDRFGLVSRSSQRDDLIEVRANAFAASFLLPDDGLRLFIAGLGKGKANRASAEVFDEAGSLDVPRGGRSAPGSQTLQLYDVLQLAHHFGVSRLSALFRLRNLRLISEADFDHLKALDDAGKGKQLADMLGLPSPRHGEERNEFRHRFLGLALEAYRRQEISHSKLSELAAMLGLAAPKLGQLLDEAGLPNISGRGATDDNPGRTDADERAQGPRR